ncbi:hypothetical protein ACQPU1_08100 [Clostridium paraputrificum]|uniref:hypothetical protein n=1 Tax=Clostridium paraputrificum TaxID=29363 RepID=UPI003D3485F8
MKRGMIIAIAGTFIVATIMLCTGSKDIYQKKVHYKSKNEVIDVLNNEILSAFDNSNFSSELVYSDAFKECLSQRKRLTESGINFSRLDLKVNENINNEEEKKKISADYLKRLENLEKVNKSEKIEAIPLTGKAYREYPAQWNMTNEICGINMNVVLIDEGEGWVIDYVMYDTFELGEEYDTSEQ